MLIPLHTLDVARLGELRPDGSIRLHDKNRDYRRIRQTPQDVMYLHTLGFVEIMSSNVSAAKVDGEDLLIRFHNSAVYRYPGKGYLFKELMNSNSKGRFVHRRLRATGARFTKEGQITTPSGRQSKESIEQVEERMEQDFQQYNIPITDIRDSLVHLLLKNIQTENTANILTPLNLRVLLYSRQA